MAFSDDIIQAVWEKGRGMPDVNSDEWCQDQCGAWLHREQYNNAESEYGWKILNVVPGGEDRVENLQPFHWNNTFDISNGRSQCHITADRTGMAAEQQVNQPRNTRLRSGFLSVNRSSG